MLAWLRRILHRHYKFLRPVWTKYRELFRTLTRKYCSNLTVQTKIGPYGPYRIHIAFALSDFRKWGRGHNSGFEPCIEACRGANCVFDIGAHIGLVTLPMSEAVAVGGTVYAFEPAMLNRWYLRRHLEVNDASNVEVLDCLVGSEDVSQVRFYEQLTDTGMNSIVVEEQADRYQATMKEQVSLDRFCERRGLTPDLIKIDVEGAELNVIVGARRVLSKAKPIVILSVHPAKLSILGQSTAELKELVQRLGYSIYDANGRLIRNLVSGEYVLRGHGGF